MDNKDFDIVSPSGELRKFSVNKLQESLTRTGASNATIQQILDRVSDELYQGISSKEIYNRAFSLLKKEESSYAAKYKLKKAIYELGPTGFPFENFIAAILHYSGYDTKVGVQVQGSCVSHEVDIVASKNDKTIMIECKFHGVEGRNCDVKIPLYIQSRYMDIKNNWSPESNEGKQLEAGWVVTNTRFTTDAIAYGKCMGLYLLGWSYPENNSLKDRIDRLSLYPITVSTLLTSREKKFLLSRDVVLCKQLTDDNFYLDHLGITETRQEKIFNELKQLNNS